MKNILFATLNLLFGTCFIVFACLQFNDPDAMLWMILYGLAAVACLLFHLKRLPPKAAASYGTMILLIGLYLAFNVISQDQPLFGGNTDKLMGGAEEGREMLGAFLISAWMTVLYVCGKKKGMQ